MSDVNAIAKKLVDDVRKRCNDLLTLPDEWSELEDRIASALASERSKFAAFADEKGEPRKVLGTLPLTADGAIAMPGSFVYAKWWNGNVARGFVRHEAHGHETCCFVEMTTTTDDGRCVGIRSFLSDCYSTREAAEAATSALAAAKEQR